MYLDAATRSLRMYTDGTAAVDEPTFYASYIDIADQSFLPAISHGELTGATPAAVVAAPNVGFSRQIKQLTVFNGDTDPHTLYVEMFDNTVQRLVFVLALGVGQAAYWTHENGWQVY